MLIDLLLMKAIVKTSIKNIAVWIIFLSLISFWKPLLQFFIQKNDQMRLEAIPMENSRISLEKNIQSPTF